MRQEPVAYIGGLPVALRTPEEPHINIEVVDKEMDAMEVKFVKDIKAREKDGGIEVSDDMNTYCFTNIEYIYLFARNGVHCTILLDFRNFCHWPMPMT